MRETEIYMGCKGVPPTNSLEAMPLRKRRVEGEDWRVEGEDSKLGFGWETLSCLIIFFEHTLLINAAIIKEERERWKQSGFVNCVLASILFYFARHQLAPTRKSTPPVKELHTICILQVYLFYALHPILTWNFTSHIFSKQTHNTLKFKIHF